MSAVPVRRAAARAVPSGTNETSMPASLARPPQYPSNRSRVAPVMPSTATRRNGPVPVPVPIGETVSPVYAEGARIDSCGLDRRCGSSGSTSAVVTMTAFPSARA